MSEYIKGARQFVSDKFIFGVLDYKFAFGVGVFRFWACDEFWGPIVTDSSLNHIHLVVAHNVYVTPRVC